MDCWTLLDLPDDADERSIKRSYARQLKGCRPDEDAEGFQRLREAYEQALNIARWRLEDEPENSPCAEPVELHAYENLREWSGLLELQPLSPGPAAPVPADPTQALLAGLTEHNLDERWRQAQQQQCGAAFQVVLLNRCFEQPGQRSAIASWAVQHLQWLTPWQSVPMTAWQANALASDLLQEQRQRLQELLESAEERQFISQLSTFGEQPWLQVFDRRQEWQRIILLLLNDTQWSVPLFERVCQLFAWDDKSGTHPEPAWIWRGLIERCEQESFFQHLQARARDNRPREPDIRAAHLLLNPLSPRQQQQMTHGFDHDDWQACEALAQTLTWRYPQLIERLPQSDMWFWRQYLPRPVGPSSWVRVWAGTSLALCLFYNHQNRYSLDISLMTAIILGWIPVWIGRLAMSWWVPISSRLISQDLWLSKRLLPPRINPDGYWLVLRHGVPQLAMLAVFGTLLGGLGVLIYLGALLINLLDRRRIGQIDPHLSARHPWLTALHWAHWSPLQLAFVLLMLGVLVFCQLYYPGFPLTTLKLG